MDEYNDYFKKSIKTPTSRLYQKFSGFRDYFIHDNLEFNLDFLEP